MERDRIIRVSDNLKKEIANFIQTSDLKDSCGFISINHVDTSRDPVSYTHLTLPTN